VERGKFGTKKKKKKPQKKSTLSEEAARVPGKESFPGKSMRIPKLVGSSWRGRGGGAMKKKGSPRSVVLFLLPEGVITLLLCRPVGKEREKDGSPAKKRGRNFV